MTKNIIPKFSPFKWVTAFTTNLILLYTVKNVLFGANKGDFEYYCFLIMILSTALIATNIYTKYFYSHMWFIVFLSFAIVSILALYW